MPPPLPSAFSVTLALPLATLTSTAPPPTVLTCTSPAPMPLPNKIALLPGAGNGDPEAGGTTPTTTSSPSPLLIFTTLRVPPSVMVSLPRPATASPSFFVNVKASLRAPPRRYCPFSVALVSMTDVMFWPTYASKLTVCPATSSVSMVRLSCPPAINITLLPEITPSTLVCRP